MGNVFLDWFRKNKFNFGVIISIITSIIIILTAIQYADLIKRDWIYFPITLVLFLLLFMWYVKIKEEKWKKQK